MKPASGLPLSTPPPWMWSAARLQDITFRRANTVLDGAALKAWGEQLARRVTGLLEPLRLLEIDETAQGGPAAQR